MQALGQDPRDSGGVWFGVTAMLCSAVFLYITVGRGEWSDMRSLWPLFPAAAALGWLCAWLVRPREISSLVMAAIAGVGAASGLCLHGGRLSAESGRQLASWWPLILVALGWAISSSTWYRNADMLIGIDASRALRVPRTGTENYSLYLIRALVAAETAHRFVLYSDREPPAGLIEGQNVTWRVMPFRRLWTHLRLGWEVTAHPPDVLFVPAHVLPLGRRCPAVATVHDLGYLYHAAAHRPLDRAYLRLGTAWNCKSAGRVLADSLATRDDIMTQRLCAPGKIVVAYPAGTPGMAPVSDPHALRAVQERYGTGDLYWLYVGTLQPRKNLETLIGAFAALAREYTARAHAPGAGRASGLVLRPHSGCRRRVRGAPTALSCRALCETLTLQRC